ncbi:MAG: hypothetical protein Q7J98_02850 [Kiritimatiellia bacterium]|nr:hypothetical protein [Kiritimatiellia bacterium]
MWNRDLTPAAYRKSLAALAELELWFAAEKNKARNDEFNTAVNTWTDLYSFSIFHDKKIPAAENRGWNAFLEKLPSADMESCVNALIENFAPRIGQDLEKAKRDISESFAGFMCEYHHDYFKPPESGDMLTLHFRNYFAPDSPSDHGSELMAGLLALVNKAESERPAVKMAQCASWLNNIPFFLELFPEEWRKNSRICPYKPSTGWWGQFIDRRGGINRRNVEYLKEKRDFKYANVHCICGIGSLKRHLEEFLPGAD